MRISKLSIQNFRNFDKFEINFLDENFNIILGENGSGKTSILDAIKILVDKEVSSGKFISESDYKDINKDILLELEINFNKNDSNLYSFKEFISNINGDNITVILGFYKESKNSDTFYYYGRKSFFGLNINIEDIKKYETSLKTIKNNIIKVLHIEGARGAKYFYDYGSIYYNFIKKIHAEHKDKIRISKEEIQELEQIKKIVEGNDNSLSSRLGKTSLEQDRIPKKIGFDDGDEVSLRTFYNLLKLKLENKFLDENSTGRQYIFYVVFCVFFIKELSSINTSEEEMLYIILMEEPEAHLHPQSQRLLLQFLKDEFNDNLMNVSLFITTHAPNIIRATQDIKKLHLIKKNESKILPENIGNLQDYFNKLNIFIDINKAEMLFARGIIFVEGIAEEILIPKLFQVYKNKSLEKYGISVINVNSTDFYCYALYATSLKIPYVIITDGDITKEISYQGTTRMNNHSNIFNENNFFYGTDTFEIDLLKSGNKNIILNAFDGSEIQRNNFSTKIDEILRLDINNDINIYKSTRNSILETYIDKSNLSFALLERLNNGAYIIIPEYIKNAFDKIFNIFNPIDLIDLLDLKELMDIIEPTNLIEEEVLPF